MEIQTITYDNKTALNVNADIPNINKVADNDMNEIKSVVNNNANVLGNIATALENIVSTIIESGSNSNGSYIKFADGTMICYKKIQVTSNITNRWGNLYESASAVSLGNWAETFISTPTMSVTKLTGRGAWLELVENYSATSCGTTYFVSAVSNSNVSLNVGIIGIGKWK